MQNSQNYGSFSMHLLMKEKIKQPSINEIINIAEKYLGELEVVTKEGLISLAVMDYMATFEEGCAPVQVLLSDCEDWDANNLDIMIKSQLWNCSDEDKEKVFKNCKYQIVGMDILGRSLHPHNRAKLLMSYLNVLMDLFPQCEAVLFSPSLKMIMADQIRNCEMPIKYRFIEFCVNFRFFNIENTTNKVVDTLGMNTLFLPDIQYYFHDMDPNWAINHAYNICEYLFDKGPILKNGENVCGVSDQGFDKELHWRCTEETSILAPERPVINIHTGQYATGNKFNKC
ncbi:hypothetical protein AN640_05960 [Candidatus Epulonipiscium fishelsonii]|uniref:Uncharacterized protein n=1 Tax=Candidatus Epulonipiscium fishelsonii TaxID=77094 RepID=A0ACC8XIC3_9FIRM|nr:hypothetical protein AN640_05960 [Epulopiscium sp. SCG-D08WGA-EpuloA1]